MKLVIATRNQGKVREIREKFAPLREWEILSLQEAGDPPDVEEDGTTFAENALKKARAVAAFAGLPALADDSGLVVDALGGEPGVYSARYAGEGATDAQRNELVLSKLQGVPGERRSARFVCVMALAFPDGREYTVEGLCEGVILSEPRGGQGFGYDPIFFLPDLGRSMAELSLEEKNRISHRARALEKALAILESLQR